MLRLCAKCLSITFLLCSCAVNTVIIKSAPIPPSQEKGGELGARSPRLHKSYKMKSKRKVTNIWSYKGPDKETIKGDSLTVPGEAYTIEELFARTNAGIPLETVVNVRSDTFASDEDFDVFVPENDFDMVDVMELKQQSDEVISDAKLKLEKSSKKKTSTQETKAAQSKAIDDQVDIPIEDDDKTQK